MTQAKRPEWVEKAAQAVTELYQHQKEDVEHAKERLQASETTLKTDFQQNREKIADIIHRHFQAQK
jgi:hypothetical protein